MMFESRLITTILLLISIAHSVHCSYRYVGCYEHVFYDSYFESSYMEPILCFRLCETPVIYLQNKLCRCSGGGLMNYNRQRDSSCLISCPQLGNPELKTNNTCGGSEAYSAYAEDQFYTRHAYLLDYRIQFSSCQLLYTTNNKSNAFKVKLDTSSARASLNKLERCAATCLDKNSTTKSIGFNNDDGQCLCITSNNMSSGSDLLLNATVLENSVCDRQCDDKHLNKTLGQNFQCGSKKNSTIYSLYNLADLCPIDFVYVEELKECMSKYEGLLEDCPSSSTKYIYDGNVTWSTLLRIIEQLNLTKSIVSIDFENDVEIDPSWLCPSEKNSTTSKKYVMFSSISSYVLDNGCLRTRSYVLSSHMSSVGLCLTYPMDRDQIITYSPNWFSYRPSSITQLLSDCPTGWIDLNGYCYRLSKKPKTIREAINSCITVTQAEENKKVQDFITYLSPTADEEDDEKNKERQKRIMEYVSGYLKGEIVQYVSQWQTRLGFFLLDLNLSDTPSRDSNNSRIELIAPIIRLNQSSINEFQLVDSYVTNNTNVANESCLLVTRSANKEKGSFTVQNTHTKSCSKPKHVLCTTKPVTTRRYHKGCFRKPLTLGLPAIISNDLTHELCLSVCKESSTNTAVLHMNKCYCIKASISWIIYTVKNDSEHREHDCGTVCPGNEHELCGDKDTIVVLNVPSSLFTFSSQLKHEINPDFLYDSCVNVTNLNQSQTFQFKFKDKIDIHPRHCLELCMKYEQKYALLNSDRCLCTNERMKTEKKSLFAQIDFNCTQECQGNYLYTCGNTSNSSLYSMYLMKLRCPDDFDLNEDEQRCILVNSNKKRDSFSGAQSYCKSAGGMLVKINDILEIQDILPKSIMSRDYLSIFSYSHTFRSQYDAKYFWVDRTSDNTNINRAFERTLERCTKTSSEDINQYCIALRYEKNIINGTTFYERCFDESNECSSESAMPVCVDKHFSTNVPKIQTSIVSVNTSIDSSCGDDEQYFLLDEYCYKINFHEMTWQEGKAECERDKATLFIPEKAEILSLMKSLVVRQRSYVSTGIAHVGVFYDNTNRTITSINSNGGSSLSRQVALSSLYELCQRTFLRYYLNRIPSSESSTGKKDLFAMQRTGCAYVDFRSKYRTKISCDDLPCNRRASVICQKAPIRTPRAVITKSGSAIDSTSDDDWDIDTEKSTKYIGRDFAPIFFILAMCILFVFLAFLNVFSRRYCHSISNKTLHRQRQKDDSLYTPLSNATDFDLN